MHYTQCIRIPDQKLDNELGKSTNISTIQSKIEIKEGIYFGKDLILPIDSDEFVATIGKTGSGKTAAIMKHTLYRTWTGPLVAIDIKGDLCTEYQTLKDRRRTAVLSFRKELEWTYDPLAHVRESDDDDKIANIEEIVHALFPIRIDDKNPFFTESERSIVTAGLIFFYNRSGGQEDFVVMMSNIATIALNTLIMDIADSDDYEARFFINNFISEVKDKLTGELVNVVIFDPKTLYCISQGITNRLKIFSDRRIQRVLCQSDKQVKWTELDDYSVFLSIPEDRLSLYGGITSMILNQLIRTMERRPEMHSEEGKGQQKILLALDEFARLGKMDVIADAVSTLRSKNVTILLLMQSLAQLDRIYGENTRRIIMENMGYVAILRVNDPVSQKYFSDLIGTQSVEKESCTTSYGEGTCSFQTSSTHEPIIRPHEFRTLNDIVVVTPDGIKRVEKIFYHNNPSGS